MSAAVNAANKGEFLLHTLRLSRAKVILTDAERRARVDEVADRLDTVTDVVVQDDSLSAALVDKTARTGTRRPRRGRRGRGAVLHIGHHRAVESCCHNLELPVLGCRDRRVGLGTSVRGSVLWTAMPLFHLSAAPSVLAPMLVGGTTVLAQAFHPGQVWDDIRGHGAVGFAGAGAMVSMLQNLPADARDATLPLRFISAAPIDASSYHDIEKRYGCRIVTMYGMTEAFPIAVKGVADDGVPGTSGRPNPNFDVRILDDDGNPLPVGTVGEIACRPRHPHVMSEGYVGQRRAGGPAPGMVPHR